MVNKKIKMNEKNTDGTFNTLHPETSIEQVINPSTGESLSVTLNEVTTQLEQTEQQLEQIGTNYSKFEKPIDLVSFINSKVTSNPSLHVNPFGNAEVFIPPGDYVIKDAELFASTIGRPQGLTIRGAGRQVTRIKFKPSSSNQYLFKFNDSWYHTHFSDLSFYGDLPLNTSFLKSVSHGGAQNYTFERVNWRDWNNIIKMEGSNVNSEYTMFHCGFYGIINKVLHAVESDGTSASDQFLNYNFYSCQFEVQKGDFIHMERGGSINIWGGSFIHIGSDGGTFFRLLNGTHARGVQRFLCVGVRFECRHATSKIIESEWNDGVISFINIDNGSHGYVEGHEIPVRFIFKSKNNKMPAIKFDNCALLGKHEFEFQTNSYAFPHNIVYDSCEFHNYNSPENMIVYTGTTNKGGKPTIHFRNCRGINDSKSNLWEIDYGYNLSSLGLTSKKIISLKDSNSSLPLPAYPQTAILPPNAIITKVMLFAPHQNEGGVSDANNITISVKTGEATPTVLATHSGVHRLGFNISQELFFVCNTTEKRTITLSVENAVHANGNGLCLIEYIG